MLASIVARRAVPLATAATVGGLALFGGLAWCGSLDASTPSNGGSPVAISGSEAASPASPLGIEAVTDVSGDGAGPATIAGINARGDVAGYWPYSGRAFLFTGGRRYDLAAPSSSPAPSGDPASATAPLATRPSIMVGALNERGQVAGAVDLGNGRFQPVVWHLPDAVAVPVGPPGAGTSKDINDRGDVLVDNGASVVVVHAGVGPAGGGEFTRVPAMPGAVRQYGEAINDHGVVIGSAEIVQPGGARVTRSYLWDGARLVDLGVLEPRADGYAFVRAVAINERGQVVGVSSTASDDSHAFRWEKGQMTDLGTLGGRSSFAAAINERGQVVGHAATAGEAVHAFVWADGTMMDLGVLGGDESLAASIDDAGRIAGSSTVAPGSTTTHAVLWTARTAPTGLGLVATATDLGVPSGFAASDGVGTGGPRAVVGMATRAGRAAHAFVWTVRAG
ncbi:hypothetical protein [Pseudofrankia sp. BMG5.37]|uniref:hypothetical protein n=1 Tax=Pseudofrankia sp. BMG5.37 TaxID=3050035 RepID=UPI0028939191|nr:hypothetical protein [Pseudofrankia sp. BMG5.37]MDT3444570.1 hypothetical protein [Pseudofrankia sp. BMG5.37]